MIRYYPLVCFFNTETSPNNAIRFNNNETLNNKVSDKEFDKYRNHSFVPTEETPLKLYYEEDKIYCKKR